MKKEGNLLFTVAFKSYALLYELGEEKHSLLTMELNKVTCPKPVSIERRVLMLPLR
jgi:hypothetical protein